ncbi:MAG TPA: PfkB family carbohydrate kinase [Tepidisphaeraceae bacterium]|jgi:rfaE bifunctional protein kinase chain/domain/rfaE bifunctional protein nucleotidyltransferase chain/domain
MAVQKVHTLDSLLALREDARRRGRTFVHCHGCFDVVHPGHIHHLQHARSRGDILLVSVSSDANVAKGVSRPLIPDDLRCASLAALECVDAVLLNDFPTAAELLDQVRPDVYVKGREYELSHDPRFLLERDTVIAHGGEIFFTRGDVVYSSTALIGALTDTGAFNSEKITRYARDHGLTASFVESLLARMKGRRVVVVGDTIVDRYHFCEATGIAGEGPMMTLRTMAKRDYDGGAAIVARHAASLGADVTLVTALAPDSESAQLSMRLQTEGVRVVASDHRKQLITKTRYVVDDQKMFKVDDGAAEPLDSRLEREVAEQIFAAAGDADCVIFADFGYGLLTPGLIDRVLPRLRATVPVLSADVSGKQSNLLRFRGVDLLCPTEREVRETLGDFAGGIGTVVSRLLRETDVKSALITLGKQGLVACNWPAGDWHASQGRLATHYLPALAERATDPLGAGDALLATASLALAAGATLQQAAFVGSLAAAVEIRHTGNVPVHADALLDAMLALGGMSPPMVRGLVA